ncbi:gar1/Naf1 RNA binding region domain-containing protein [Ditylenchus destructor]|uniref:H/ACA ribonucleoprotein complex non-core subunit NAF1 n=1 Tax=Ditylenchus destructor TaxID=166010 RepID=A0AAD4R4Q2_9BILA|nr:gar1/Naf1 RNA binding region domain-containing protein [Ditylenchus destructor]
MDAEKLGRAEWEELRNNVVVLRENLKQALDCIRQNKATVESEEESYAELSIVMDLISGYQTDGSDVSEDNDVMTNNVSGQKPSTSSSCDTSSLPSKHEYRDSPVTTDDETELHAGYEILSDGGDSEAEFNQILELCRKQREHAFEKSKSEHRPSVNLDKVFDSSRTFDSEYYNLPPVDDLQIHVDEDISLKRFGVVDKFIDFIVSIKPDPGAPHLDYDTILFDEHRNAIGEVFEIFGQVRDTMYSIRFNNAEEAKDALSLGTVVYYAPQEKLITKTVLTQELFKLKISDVGNDDGDSNDEDKVFSDDEAEAAYLAKRRAKARPAPKSNAFDRVPFNKRPRRTPYYQGNMNFFNNSYMS